MNKIPKPNYLLKEYSLMKEFRLHSKYYIKLAYVWLFTFTVLYYLHYILANHIEPPTWAVIILALLVCIFIPLVNIYYIIRAHFSIVKKLYDENYTNKNLWISDLIYVSGLLYILTIKCLHILFLIESFSK